MPAPEELKKQSDSLIELLTAQCADLEKLLALAREETVVAERRDFDGILKVVSERHMIGEKLETFQRQIAELRQRIGKEAQPNVQNDVTSRMAEVIRLIISCDTETKLLLTGGRQNSIDQLNTLEYSHRSSNAYLRERRKGLAYDRSW